MACFFIPFFFKTPSFFFYQMVNRIRINIPTEKYILNLVNSNQVWIIIILFRLIYHKTKFHLRIPYSPFENNESYILSDNKICMWINIFYVDIYIYNIYTFFNQTLASHASKIWMRYVMMNNIIISNRKNKTHKIILRNIQYFFSGCKRRSMDRDNEIKKAQNTDLTVCAVFGSLCFHVSNKIRYLRMMYTEDTNRWLTNPPYTFHGSCVEKLYNLIRRTYACRIFVRMAVPEVGNFRHHGVLFKAPPPWKSSNVTSILSQGA